MASAFDYIRDAHIAKKVYVDESGIICSIVIKSDPKIKLDMDWVGMNDGSWDKTPKKVAEEK